MSTWTFEEWAMDMMSKEREYYDAKIKASKVADKRAAELFWRNEEISGLWRVAIRVAARADWMAKHYKIDLGLFEEAKVKP